MTWRKSLLQGLVSERARLSSEFDASLYMTRFNEDCLFTNSAYSQCGRIGAAMPITTTAGNDPTNLNASASPPSDKDSQNCL